MGLELRGLELRQSTFEMMSRRMVDSTTQIPTTILTTPPLRILLIQETLETSDQRDQCLSDDNLVSEHRL